MQIKFFPSLLSADFGKLQSEIDSVEDIVDGFHFDVMDGHFVPNLTVGAPVLTCIKTKKVFDAHLMIENPEKYIEDFAKAGAGWISVHAETTDNPQDLLKKIQALGAKAGLVLNPETPLEPYLNDFKVADFALIMSVRPGFGGQSFMLEVLEKVRKLRAKYPEMDIQIDGGINDKTVKQAIEAGCNVIVSGSYFWSSENRAETVNLLKSV